MPTLRYDRPAGFIGGGGDGAEVWVSDNSDGLLVVYPFRSFRGDFGNDFQRTLFRDLISEPFREVQLLAAPGFGAPVIRGADAALYAWFRDTNGAAVREHMRVAIFAGGSVAIVDVSANSPQAYERNWPTVLAVLNSLNVVAAEPQPAAQPAAQSSPGSRPSASTSLSGLYITLTRSFQLNITGPPGSGSWVNRNYWYVLGEDGQVHRGYDLPTPPDGDIRRFDYDGNRRTDASNSGMWSQQGGQITLRMAEETLTATLDGEGNLVIKGSTYKRVQLKD
jgi:hypothetical protein